MIQDPNVIEIYVKEIEKKLKLREEMRKLMAKYGYMR